MNDVVFNKKESIERCIRQIRTYRDLHSSTPFEDDYLRQDAIALNLQRACEQAIDLANYTIKKKKMGLPKGSRESFTLLAENGVIPRDLSVSLGKMVGFRNVLVHQYQKLDINVMLDVIDNHLGALVDFSNCIMTFFSDHKP